MKKYNRDLLVLYKSNVINEDLIQHEVESLHRILVQVERMDVFCVAHELVKRTKITSRTKSILKVVSQAGQLKPFYFLINKN
jgi:hypothetical protein